MELHDWFGTCPPNIRLWSAANRFVEMVVEIVADDPSSFQVIGRFPLDLDRLRRRLDRRSLRALTYQGPIAIGRYVKSHEFLGVGVVAKIDVELDDGAPNYYVIHGDEYGCYDGNWLDPCSMQPASPPIIRSRRRRIITIRRT